MALKKGLGRGLDSLIINNNPLFDSTDETDTGNKTGVLMVDIYKVEPDRQQPRKEFDEEKINELSLSIQQHGILQPLLVQSITGSDGQSYYQIIAGERRWRAAKKAGLDKIPVIVKEFNPDEIFEISLIENIQRQDLNPVEEAEAYERLLLEYGMTHEQLANKIGKSRSSITNSTRILNLETEVRNMVSSGELSLGHAKVLMGVEDKDKQKALAKIVAEQGLSVRALEALVTKEGATPKKKEKVEKGETKSWIYEGLEDELREILGTKVNFVTGGKKKKLEIEYYTDEDLEHIMDIIRRAK